MKIRTHRTDLIMNTCMIFTPVTIFLHSINKNRSLVLLPPFLWLFEISTTTLLKIGLEAHCFQFTLSDFWLFLTENQVGPTLGCAIFGGEVDNSKLAILNNFIGHWSQIETFTFQVLPKTLHHHCWISWVTFFDRAAHQSTFVFTSYYSVVSCDSFVTSMPNHWCGVQSTLYHFFLGI